MYSSWVKKNRHRYACPCGQYESHNRWNFRRHQQTIGCFLRRKEIPGVVRVLIESYARPELYKEHLDFIRAYDTPYGPGANVQDRLLSIHRRTPPVLSDTVCLGTQPDRPGDNRVHLP